MLQVGSLVKHVFASWEHRHVPECHLASLSAEPERRRKIFKQYLGATIKCTTRGSMRPLKHQ